MFDEAEFARLFDLDRAFQDEGTHGDGGRDGDDEPTALLVPGEQWIIGPVTFNVFNGLDNDGLNAAEKVIRKIAKMLKCKALLDGDEMRPGGRAEGGKIGDRANYDSQRALRGTG